MRDKEADANIENKSSSRRLKTQLSEGKVGESYKYAYGESTQEKVIYKRKEIQHECNANEDVENEFLVKIMNSVVTAFFLVCIYKIVMIVLSFAYPTNASDEL